MLASVGKDAFEDRVGELKAFMLSSLSDIRGLLADDPARAKAKLAKHAGPIRLTPGSEGYTVEGEWDLLGASRASFAGASSVAIHNAMGAWLRRMWSLPKNGRRQRPPWNP